VTTTSPGTRPYETSIRVGSDARISIASVDQLSGNEEQELGDELLEADEYVLEPGGTLIVASACSEGFGSPEFRAAQARLRALGPDAFLQTLLAKSLADVDEWQTEMQLKSMRAGNVQLYTTGLNAEERSLTGVDTVDSLDAALAAAVARAGDPAIAVVPEGPYVVPVVA